MSTFFAHLLAVHDLPERVDPEQADARGELRHAGVLVALLDLGDLLGLGVEAHRDDVVRIDVGAPDRLQGAHRGRTARRVHGLEVRVGGQDRLRRREPLVLGAVGAQLADDLELALERPEPGEHAAHARVERRDPGHAGEHAQLVARLQLRREVLAREDAALEVVRRDDRRLALPGRDVVVEQDDLDALLDGLVERLAHGRARGRDGDALDALRDHVLDRRDLTRVVRGALALGERDRRARMRLVPLLRRVLEREEEPDGELRDESQLDRRGPAAGRGRGLRLGPRGGAGGGPQRGQQHGGAQRRAGQESFSRQRTSPPDGIGR